MILSANLSSQLPKCWRRKKLISMYSPTIHRNINFMVPRTTNSQMFGISHTESTSLLRTSCCKQKVRFLSEKVRQNEHRTVPSIWSYFSSAQRDIRERRADGLPLPDTTQKQSLHRVYSLGSPGEGGTKLSEFRAAFYTLQIFNLSVLLGSSLSCGYLLTGSLPSFHILSEDCVICNQIALGLGGIMMSIYLFGSMFMLWRFPIR